MGKVLLLPLLFLILTVIPEGVLGTSDTDQCNIIEKTVKDGESKTIMSETFTESEFDMDLGFLRENQNLEVTINVQERDGNQQTVLIPFDEKCYEEAQPTKWLMLHVWSTVMTDGIKVGVTIANNNSCSSSCVTSGPWNPPINVCVMASGCSQWKMPPYCPGFKRIGKNSKQSSNSTCKIPGMGPGVIVMALALVLSAVILVSAGLIMWFKKRQRDQHLQMEQTYDTLTFQQTDDMKSKKGGLSKPDEALYEEVIIYDDVTPGRRESAHYTNAPLYDDVKSEKA